MSRVTSTALVIAAALACSLAQARDLERYLIGAAELPAGCQRVSELFPLNDKVSKFYEGKAYRSVIPVPVDRHVQSFDCEGQKGTLYFYQYPTPHDKDQALLFARPVLTQGTGAPQVVEWKSGFVVLSFAQMPETLRQQVLEKLGEGQTALPPAAAPAVTPSAPSPAEPVVLSPAAAVVQSTAAVVQSSEKPAALPVSPAPVPPEEPLPPTAPVPVTASTAAAPSLPPMETPKDISNKVLDKIRKVIDCRDRSLPAELIQVCGWIEAFRKGITVAPFIPATDTRIGMGYRVDGMGRLERRFYQAAVGSGAVGEISIVPVFTATGVEELELEAVMAGSSGQKPLPSSELIRRIAGTPRPTQRTFIPTDGKSWLAYRPGQTLYLRRSGKQWILLALDNETEDSLERYALAITAFH